MRFHVFAILAVLLAGPVLADSHAKSSAGAASHAAIAQTNQTLRSVLDGKDPSSEALRTAVWLQQGAAKAFKAGDYKAAKTMSEQARSVAAGKVDPTKIEATDYLSGIKAPKKVDRAAIDALELEPLPAGGLFNEEKG